MDTHHPSVTADNSRLRSARPIFFFFFQAEDGIRDYKVTGVQTCALPILASQVKIFNWLATMWGGTIRATVPFHYAAGLVALFPIGGLSGIMHASPPVDLQQTDSYFVVAHLHYVLIGGSLFGILAGASYWWPKMTGRMLDEWLGRVAFWIIFAGFNLT